MTTMTESDKANVIDAIESFRDFAETDESVSEEAVAYAMLALHASDKLLTILEEDSAAVEHPVCDDCGERHPDEPMAHIAHRFEDNVLDGIARTQLATDLLDCHSVMMMTLTFPRDDNDVEFLGVRKAILSDVANISPAEMLASDRVIMDELEELIEQKTQPENPLERALSEATITAVPAEELLGDTEFADDSDPGGMFR